MGGDSPPHRRPPDPPSSSFSSRRIRPREAANDASTSSAVRKKTPPPPPGASASNSRAAAAPPYLLDASNNNNNNNATLPQNYPGSYHQYDHHHQSYYHNHQPRNAHDHNNIMYNNSNNHNQNGTTIMGSHNRDRTTLRKRGSSVDGRRLNNNGHHQHQHQHQHQSSSPHHHHILRNGCDNNNNINGGGVSVSSDADNGCYRRRHHHHHNHPATAAHRRHSKTKAAVLSTSRLSQIIALFILCALMLWGSFWGLEMGLALARGTANVIFFGTTTTSSGSIGIGGDGEQRGGGEEEEEEEDDDIYSGEQVEVEYSKEQSSQQQQQLRGSSSDAATAAAATAASSSSSGGGETLSVHDLNARSHLLKAEGRQIINDRPMEVDEEGKGDKSYMGSDATLDFFYAGEIVGRRQMVNAHGRIERVSYPAAAYSVLPASLDHRQFAISVWVYLSPLGENNTEEEGGGGEGEGGIYEEDGRRPRVVLSTRTKDVLGCRSDAFGEERPVATTGMVLYAQPHHGDDDGGAEGGGDDDKGGGTTTTRRGAVATYRFVLEYAQVGKNACRVLVGSDSNVPLVREGEWRHVVIFATTTGRAGAEERISLYVDGDVAGREASERLRNYSPLESKTTIGRCCATTQLQSSLPGGGIGGNNNFDLGGRVGMLSYWETGDMAILSKKSREQRMILRSESDEDHVVNAINRAAFDVRAIRELSLQGLTVKEPTLLYAFDGQRGKEEKMINELYSDDSPKRRVREVMTGRDGTILSEPLHGGANDAFVMPAKDDRKISEMQMKASALLHEISEPQMKGFKPLGGNRYAEYKDGTYVPPGLKASERRELDEIARARGGVVKKAMQHAWSGYTKYAYGKDELLPVSKKGQDNWGGMGTTLVDSLSTLWIMNMTEEFWEARDWVRRHLDFSQVSTGVSVFETTIRNLGGLLSAYDLSSDVTFLRKADDLGMRLMRAFDSRTGIPYSEVELFDGGRAYNTGWHRNEAVLSEIGTLQVEFRYLAKVTGKSEYATNAMRALDELLKLDAESGLYPTFIYNTKQDLSFGNSDITIGAMGDSFYEYLLKVWLQGGKKEMKYRRLYDKSINGIMDKLIHMSTPSYLTYVAELKNNRLVRKMDHLSCFLGGNLALGAYTHPDGIESAIAQKQLRTGKQLAYTCYQMYARSKSGLSPEYVKFETSRDDFVKGHASYYILRPETAETFFILYHLTKDPVYREWGWEIFQAIEETCKTEAGYAAIRDVDTMNQDNRMESFFLAETLKYLYLLQDDTNEIDLLNTHVFNTEAHPLRLLKLAPEGSL